MKAQQGVRAALFGLVGLLAILLAFLCYMVLSR